MRGEGGVACSSGLNCAHFVCRSPQRIVIQKVRWCPHGARCGLPPRGCALIRWCPSHGHPLVSDFVTKRPRGSCGPLTSQLPSCAFDRHLCPRAIAQASSGVPRRFFRRRSTVSERGAFMGPKNDLALGGGGGASGGGCLPQPRWAVCATGAGAHQGQTNREGEKDIWWTAGTARGGTGHLGLTHTETQRGRLWTACGQRCVGSKYSQTTPATTSTSSIRQLLGSADAQTAHPATFSTAPAHQPLGSANAETTPAGALAAAADRTQRPNATCEGKNG